MASFDKSHTDSCRRSTVTMAHRLFESVCKIKRDTGQKSQTLNNTPSSYISTKTALLNWTTTTNTTTTLLLQVTLSCPRARREEAISLAFVRPSVHPSVSPSVCLSVAYVANNSRTQRPIMPKFERKVHNLRCDSHTSFKVKPSKVIRDGRGHTVSAELSGHTCLLTIFYVHVAG